MDENSNVELNNNNQKTTLVMLTICCTLVGVVMAYLIITFVVNNSESIIFRKKAKERFTEFLVDKGFEIFDDDTIISISNMADMGIEVPKNQICIGSRQVDFSVQSYSIAMTCYYKEVSDDKIVYERWSSYHWATDAMNSSEFSYSIKNNKRKITSSFNSRIDMYDYFSCNADQATCYQMNSDMRGTRNEFLEMLTLAKVDLDDLIQ